MLMLPVRTTYAPPSLFINVLPTLLHTVRKANESLDFLSWKQNANKNVGDAVSRDTNWTPAGKPGVKTTPTTLT